MPVPKKKRSYMKTRLRRSHHALKGVNLIPCPVCEEKIPPHRVCPNCGSYKGQKLINE